MNYQKIQLSGGVVVTADTNETARCKFCFKDIVWGVTKNSKKIPIEKLSNGLWYAHFANCNKQKRLSGNEDLLSELNRQQERDRW